MKGRAGEARREAPFVLVTGGKGGVGKTTIAANLGVELALGGWAPVALDLDFGLADLATVLRLAPEHDSEDFFERGRPLADCLTAGPGGLRVLAASDIARDAGRDGERRERLRGAAGGAALAAGIVLGDSAAGIGPDVLDFALHADRVLVVTTPDPAALTDAYCTIKALDLAARKAGREVPTPDVFVNLAGDAAQAQAVSGRLRSVCERFLCRSPRLVGWMPRGRSVLSASARQEAFVLSEPRSPAARSIRQLARRFSDLAVRRRAPALVAQGAADHGR